MNKTLTIAQWELHRGLKSKAFIVSVFMPFVVLLISILPSVLAFSGDIDAKDVGIIDQGNGIYEEIADHLDKQFITNDGQSVYTIQEYQTTPENHDTLINTLVKDNIAGIVIVIQPDFMNKAEINIYHNDNVGLEEISKLKGAIRQYSMEKRIVSLGMVQAEVPLSQISLFVTVYRVCSCGFLSWESS